MADGPASPEIAAEARARAWALAPLCGAFVLDHAAAGIAGMDARDALLVLAINQANIGPQARDPDAQQRCGAVEGPLPDAVRRPVPLSAVAASLGLPRETVRRRVSRLAAQGVCGLTDSGAVVPESFLNSPAYRATAAVAHARLVRFYREVAAAGLMEPLPPSRYPPEPAVPLRSALRVLADYLLRATENVMALTGDLVSGLTFLGVLSGGNELPPPVSSTAALARRMAMPHETVRRHAADLVGRGWCLRLPRGFSIAEEVLARPEVTALFQDNAANVQRLFAQLADRGVVEAWERLSVATLSGS